MGSPDLDNILGNSELISREKVLLFGAFGAVSPTLARRATALPTENPEFIWGALLLGMVFLAAVGAIVAAVYAHPTIKSAFTTGIAAPAIVAGGLLGTNEGSAQPREVQATTTKLGFISPETTPGFTLIPMAYAQTTSPSLKALSGALAPRPPLESVGVLSVTPKISGGRPAATSLDYSWATPEGKELGGSGQLSIDTPQNLLIPPGAGQLTIMGETISIEEWTQRENSLDLEIQTAPTLTGDFLWALGAKRRFEIDQLAIGE